MSLFYVCSFVLFWVESLFLRFWLGGCAVIVWLFWCLWGLFVCFRLRIWGRGVLGFIVGMDVVRYLL